MENTSNAPQQGGYGYSEHVAKESSTVFGLNAGNVRLTKFAHTMKGGKDDSDLEALDIVFTIDGNDKGYRRFPISRAYAKDESGAQIEVTDSQHPEFIAAQMSLSSVLVHIVGCFVEKEAIKTALARPIQSFKEYCGILQSLLPNNFDQIPLDAFMQYQWTISGENKVTYLEFPKNMKHGRWLGTALEAKGEAGWTKQQKPNAGTGEVALRYVDEEGNKHPFARNGWFMTSNFATQQKEAPSAGSQAMSASGGTSESSGDW